MNSDENILPDKNPEACDVACDVARCENFDHAAKIG